MKKIAALILSPALVIVMGFGLTSCKDDDPPSKPKLSFAETEIEVDEDDGVLEVELVLDKPHSKDLRIEYDLGGTADDQDAVGTANADYEVDGDHGVVEIEAGETTGIIRLEIYADAGFEEDETIEISITDTNTDEIELTADDETVITLKNDDVPLQLTFASPTMSVNEADQAFEVQLTLDKPAPKDITFTYTLSGSATDSLTVTAANKLSPDYKAKGTAGQFQIKAGQTTGVISFAVYSDLLVEDTDLETDVMDPETIIITVTNLGGIQMPDNTMEISLQQEDGLVIALFWPTPADGKEADMDLLLRVGENTTTWLGVITGSAAEGGEGPEVVFIPNAIDFPAYGLSYVYYEGTLDPLEFEVVFIDLIDQVFEPEANTLSYTATYTAANKNPWTNVSQTKVVQTFEKTETGFTTPTAITVPTEGSRVKSRDNFHSTFERGGLLVNRSLRRTLKDYRIR